ncbi:MAG TPA: hypothetical protein VM260_28395, partial [Pirellula sp.]|nr:hypothetical protein [Pirellula sp.]
RFFLHNSTGNQLEDWLPSVSMMPAGWKPTEAKKIGLPFCSIRRSGRRDLQSNSSHKLPIAYDQDAL